MEEKRKESSQYPVYQSSVETVVLNMTLSRVEEHAAAHSCELSGSCCTDFWTKRRATIRKEGRVSIIVVFALGVVSLFGEGEGEVRRVLGAAEGGMMDYNIFPYIDILHITKPNGVIAGAKPEWVSMMLRIFLSATPTSMAAGSSPRIYGLSCGHTRLKEYVVTCWHASTVHPSLHASFSLFGQ